MQEDMVLSLLCLPGYNIIGNPLVREPGKVFVDLQPQGDITEQNLGGEVWG